MGRIVMITIMIAVLVARGQHPAMEGGEMLSRCEEIEGVAGTLCRVATVASDVIIVAATLLTIGWGFAGFIGMHRDPRLARIGMFAGALLLIFVALAFLDMLVGYLR